MKRIFIIQNTPLNEPLPLSICLTRLLECFKKDNAFEFNLIVGKSNKIPPSIKKLCNKIYQFNASTYSIKDNLKFSYEVYKILKKENQISKIDIINCFYPNSSLLGAVLFKKFSNNQTRIVYTLGSPWIEMSIERGFINKNLAGAYKSLLYSEEKYLCKYVDAFMFVTKDMGKYYKRKLKLRKDQYSDVGFSGVDLDLFKPAKTNIRDKHGIKKDEILIGSVGGMAKIRKLDKFLDTFNYLLEHKLNAKMMFIGEGDALDGLKKRVAELNLSKRVIFVGKINQSEVPKYISAFDYGLCHLPRIFIYEYSFPLKVLEYLACGVPVLASELSTHISTSKKLRGVFIYKNAEDILRIINSRKKVDLRQNLNEYSWESIAKKYIDIYRRLQ